MSRVRKPSEKVIEERILELLDERDETASICPSEVARSLDADDWRALMSEVRVVADKLSKRKVIIVTQKGMPVESAERATGPIRLRKTR